MINSIVLLVNGSHTLCFPYYDGPVAYHFRPLDLRPDSATIAKG